MSSSERSFQNTLQRDVAARANTERPETLKVGPNIFAGTDPATIVTKVQIMLNEMRRWKNLFGDGKAAQRIVRILREEIR
jgi:UDP-N-acetylglucosamine 2-epimerase